MLEDGLVIEIKSKFIDHLTVAGVGEDDLREIALRALARGMYRRKVLSLGLAAQLADQDRAEFVTDLAQHNVDIIDLLADDAERELTMVDSLLGRKKQQ